MHILQLLKSKKKGDAISLGFPGGYDGKESACNAGDPGWILGWKDPLKKGMAAHSSVLVWEIPWTEESVGLQSTGNRVECNRVTDTFTFFTVSLPN